MRRRLIASLCVAAALLLPSPHIGAQNGESAPMWSITIESSGSLAASLRAGGSGHQVAWRGSDRTLDLLLDMIDLRGVPAGWTVLVSERTSHRVSLRPETIQMWMGNPDMSSMETFLLNPVTTVPAPLWTVDTNHGDGFYTLALESTLPYGPSSLDARPITLILDLQGDAP